MEKIVRIVTLNIILCVINSAMTNAQVSESRIIIEEIQNRYGNNEVIHYYLKEQPNISEYTVSTESMNLTPNVLNVHFYSEVADSFTFYVNDELIARKDINTMQRDGKISAYAFEINFPSANDEFTLKVISSKYGSFETEARKAHPMLYLKNFNNTWYLAHTNVFRIPFMNFLKNPAN
jgi:hypothetical protein